MVAQRVGMRAFEAGLHRVRDGGQSELAHVAIDERISLVSVGRVQEAETTERERRGIREHGLARPR